MYKKLLSLTLIAAALAACGKDKSQQTQLNCDGNAVLQNVQDNIKEVIKQDALAFAQNDVRQFVDADKIIAAASELKISLDNAKEENYNGTSVCSANLNIQIPPKTLNISQANSPLIYKDQPLSQIIQQRISGSNLNYDNAGTFSRLLRYTPTEINGQFSVSYEDNGLTTSAQTISAVLLPYGIKDIILAMTITDALAHLSQPLTASQAFSPEAILNQNAASSTFLEASQPNQAASATEILTPTTDNTEEAVLSTHELDQARNDNRSADDEINHIWNKMDRAVQQSLLNEQRTWIKDKNNSCQQAAARASSSFQAEYLQLQCDTRMTRERSQYLRGYIIN